MNSASRPPRTILGLRKLPARYAGFVMPFLLSVFMSGVVSLISTLHSLGLVHDLPRLWIGAWVVSWGIAFPTLLLVLPVVRRLTRLIVETP
ncbi:MAG: DUF2798 domain-containing protein [Gammaproteobacteria bacterium]|nr:DUF2798 domain-containing protein [Gammaproteobacteria bacterium]